MPSAACAIIFFFACQHVTVPVTVGSAAQLRANSKIAIKQDDLLAQQPDVNAWFQGKRQSMVFVLYIGRGGMGSMRNELINALLITRGLSYSLAGGMQAALVLDDAGVAWDDPYKYQNWDQPFRSAYDITKMRSQQLNTLGTTFLWTSELLQAGITFFDTHGTTCTDLRVPIKTDVGVPTSDIAAHVRADVHNTAGLFKWSNAAHSCLRLPCLDGRSGWNLDTSQCHKSVDCTAIFNSFPLHPNVQASLTDRKTQAENLLHGGQYTCLHVNSYWCESGVSEGVPWADCIATFLKSMLYDANFLSRDSAILLVGQQDTAVKPILQTELLKKGASKNIITVADLGLPALNASYDWYTQEYAQRGAVSWGLCSPGYAHSYIGEAWSGFTWTLLEYGLANPRSLGDWAMMMYSYPQGFYNQLAAEGKFIGPREVPNYYTTAKGKEIMPTWLISPPWVDRR